MRARRCSSRDRAASLPRWLAGVAIGVLGCGRSPSSDTGAAATGAAPAASARPGAVIASQSDGVPARIGAVARDTASRALAAARALEAKLAAREAVRTEYLALRRAIAAGAPYWQRLAGDFAEPMLGPRRSTVEAGGALLALDTALARNDDAASAEQLRQIVSALRVIEDGMGAKQHRSTTATQILSDAAYDLGLGVLEATPGAPEGHDAVLADLRGMLDGIERGCDALVAAGAPEAEARLRVTEAARPLRAAFDAATTSLDLVDRAPLARSTGALGIAVRRLGAAVGFPARPPYRARAAPRSGADDQEISALTLPGPRALARPDAEAQAAFTRLGEKLFHDRRLSPGDVRSCASCHDPARAFADGSVRPRSLVGTAAPLRHTPTLLYAPVAAVQMWDGRTLTPEAQARNVIHSTAEMGLSAEALVAKLSVIPDYANAFAALPAELDMDGIARALVAYESAVLVPDAAPIDRYGRGDDTALSAEERSGLDVFVGKGRCARCHVPPLFGGSRPHDFAVPVFAVLGVPTAPAGKVLDPDRGRGAVTRAASDERAFKTPTVRNAARTAPYFHNGAFPRLEDVLDFYDKGGGRGLGLTIENQDPDVRPLRLKPEERRALLAFMRTGLLDL